MILIKLDRRHRLYRSGYQYAFVVDRWTKEAYKIESAIIELEGVDYGNTFWGKYKMDKSVGYNRRPYYIGFKKEYTATLVALKI